MRKKQFNTITCKKKLKKNFYLQRVNIQACTKQDIGRKSRDKSPAMCDFFFFFRTRHVMACDLCTKHEF